MISTPSLKQMSICVAVKNMSNKKIHRTPVFKKDRPVIMSDLIIEIDDSESDESSSTGISRPKKRKSVPPIHSSADSEDEFEVSSIKKENNLENENIRKEPMVVNKPNSTRISPNACSTPKKDDLSTTNLSGLDPLNDSRASNESEKTIIYEHSTGDSSTKQNSTITIQSQVIIRPENCSGKNILPNTSQTVESISVKFKTLNSTNINQGAASTEASPDHLGGTTADMYADQPIVQTSQPVQILDNTHKKCRKFLANLLTSCTEPKSVERNVRTLIQELIDNKVEPEDFCGKLEKLLNASPQPIQPIEFLKKSLPPLRHSLATQELTIDGIRPPLIDVVTTAGATTVHNKVAKQSGTIKSSSKRGLATQKDNVSAPKVQKLDNNAKCSKRLLFDTIESSNKTKVNNETSSEKTNNLNVDPQSIKSLKKNSSTNNTPKPNSSKSDISQPSCSKSLDNANCNLNPSETTEKNSIINKSVSPSKTPIKCDLKSSCSKLSTKDKNLNGIRSPSKSPRKSPNSSIKKKQLNEKLLDVFDKLLKEVVASKHLKGCIVQEIATIRRFAEMEKPYKYLCLKLFTWQRKWYNMIDFCDRIHLNMEDHEKSVCYDYLRNIGFVDTDFSVENEHTLLHLLRTHSVRNIYETFRLPKRVNKKDDMITAIISNSNIQATLSYSKSIRDVLKCEIQKKMGKCIRISETLYDAFYRVYLLGTFTTPEFTRIQDYFHNIIDNKVVFPDYDLEEYSVFYSKEEFLSYAKARELKNDMYDALDHKKNIVAYEICRLAFGELKRIKDNEDTDTDDSRYQNTPHLKHFTAEAVYVSVLSKSVKYLTPSHPNDVLTWLTYLIQNTKHTNRYGHWYNQLALIYTRYTEPKDYEGAAKLVIEALLEKKTFLSEIQLHELGKRGKAIKTNRKYKIDRLYRDRLAEVVPPPVVENFSSTTVDARAVRSNKPGQKRNYVDHDQEGNKIVMSVEDIALDYYIKDYGYSHGKHCEGSILKAIFTILFWDVMYHPKENVPGTFVTKFQTEPLDTFTPNFYENRLHSINQRLSDIEEGWDDERLKQFAKDMYEKYSHIKAVFGEAGRYLDDAAFLETMIDCIGRKILAKVFKRLVKNMREYRSGFPDLLIWNIQTKKSKFVEVKGENDKLSMQQTLWLNYLYSIEADVELCHVHSIGSKRILKKKGTKSSVPPEND